MPRCVVIDEHFDWEDDRPPRRRWTETVIYETHVKGFTMRHPGGPRGPARHLRRRSPPTPAIAYLRELGVTAVELLPVHHIADEAFLVERGLSNYWGYSSIGYLAPHAALRRDRQPRRAGARVQGDGQGAAPRPASR